MKELKWVTLPWVDKVRAIEQLASKDNSLETRQGYKSMWEELKAYAAYEEEALNNRLGYVRAGVETEWVVMDKGKPIKVSKRLFNKLLGGKE